MTADPSTIEVRFGDRRVLASVRRSERRYLRIDVDPNCSVSVTAPSDACIEEIERRANRRGAWVFRKIDHIAGRPPQTPERRFVSGETHLFLGRQYRLAIELAEEAGVRLDGGRLVVGVRRIDDQAHCRRLLKAFYALEARFMFRERLCAVFPPFERRGLKRPKLIIRNLARRWGSFTPKGHLILNVDLIRATPAQIDYVICHELVHGFHPDHGPEWRKLFDTLMPDWPQRKALLEVSLW
jgi:hypothetical protein